jgi:hypothetical protein
MDDWIQAIQMVSKRMTWLSLLNDLHVQATDNYRRLRVASRTSIAAPINLPISMDVPTPIV